MSHAQPLIFRKGLDMKEAVAAELSAAYDSQVVVPGRADDNPDNTRRRTVHHPRVLGVC